MSPPEVLQPADQLGDLQAGEEALARGAWAEARTRFATALQRAETPEALEGFGMAAWWLADAAAYLPARERAYHLYRERDDRRGAGRTAIWLGLDAFLYRGEHAVCNGWFGRAHRLLDGLEPGFEQPLLAVWEGYVALCVRHDTACARRLGAEAAALARSCGILDMEMLAQALLGLTLVRMGDVAEGMPLLDEATAVATGGEMTDLDAIVSTCCFLISACEYAGDFDRAAQWCEKAIQLAERWSYRFMFSFCRTRYATMLMRRGAWAAAEVELTAATDDLAATFPAMAAEGCVRLAELRRCQGQLAEAADLLERLGRRPLRMFGNHRALVERAALALERGDAARATELAERALRACPPENRLERIPALVLLVRSLAARGDRERAAEALGLLRASAAPTPGESLRAALHVATGEVAAAVGEHHEARRHFEDAVDLYVQCGLPYEAALASLTLANTLVALDRPASAEDEVRAALDTFRRVGAAPAVARAEGLLRRLRSLEPRQGDPPAGRIALTPRELEVLRLIAQGQSDREIAATLGRSEHTIHRHISNILTRLALPSRAAAVAHAARHSLL